MKPRLNIITLGVNDLNKSKQFYKEALGWGPTKDSDDNIVFFNHGGIILGLYPINKLAEDAELSAVRNGFSGVTLAINLDTKEAVTELYKTVIENGGSSLVKPRDTFWGGYDAYFADPDGHSWEIAWAPFWKFDEQGSLIME
ncbi:VOC family protein [Draconibacterium sp. IB214405]|uniref:VOC family protein n=1 Tax=Draconibacterium sp. IB214405 TaxID=3097352 RepID=UPI002A104706|nr:VOC family protein [Draconibacterium sp. IB214405]MDX8340935.1 VOC family protein [Draconibacterium sp. IB214405]